MKIYCFCAAMMALVLCPHYGMALEISGAVTDRMGTPVVGAMVRFTDAANPQHSVSVYTDAAGRYVVDATTSVGTGDAGNMQLFCYPNPFNRQTVISFYLDAQQYIELAVYGMTGQKVRVIASGEYAQGYHQLVWDGLSQQGAPAVPGLYICNLHAASGRQSIKMLVQGGDNVAVPVWPHGDTHGGKAMIRTEMQQVYHVTISGDGFVPHQANGLDLNGVSVRDFVINRDVWAPFSTVGDYLGTYNGDGYTPFFIKGINLGAAVPGSLPGQLAISAEQYRRWFRMMAEAGFNTVRIYTLHYPHFYKELARYNTENPDRPLYLLQGVWLNEGYPDNYYPDLHALTAEFDTDIGDAIDCLHGNKKLEHRFGYAYGEFTADVSPWLLGMIVGREVSADEIVETDYAQPTHTSYAGTHLAISGASPSEVWITERLDRLIAYERANYHTTRPVAFSSWPTLDPLRHPSEPVWGFEDAADVDLNRIVITDAPGGFFISYHAYPYYPNFISNDAKYKGVSDATGVNPYLAYLRELRSHYTKYPVMVAEFGVPTSWGNARYSPSGMNHGGMTEEEQGNYTMRMFHNIYDTHYCGAVMFSWMDEWFKTTWIVQPLTSPRRNLWHNVTSPENNYGLIQFVPDRRYYNTRQTQTYNFGRISQTSVWHDFAWFNIDAKLTTPLATGDTLWIALDTYKRNVGESTLPNRRKVLNRRAEFLVRLTADSARLYVTDAYNMQGIIHMNCHSPAFQTKTTDGAPWIPYKWQNNETDLFPNIQDIGKLNVCRSDETFGTHHAVQLRSDGIYIRLPWTLLHFADPSTLAVIDDVEAPAFCLEHWGCDMQYLKTIRTEGIAVTAVCGDQIAELTPYTWSDWDVNSAEILNRDMFEETEKASLPIIREGLKTNSFTPY